VPGQRTWVVLDGIFYQADVWLDGAYLGDPEGYFFPHSYDVTALAGIGREHVLAVEVACAPQRDAQAKRNITGIFQHWDCIDPSWNPGGLWRPVRLERTGPVRIEKLRVLCRDATADRANLFFHALLDSDVQRTVRITTRAGDYTERTREQPLAKGLNEVQWTFGIDNPRLWWPWALGPQELIDVSVDIAVDHASSHRRTVRTGLRQVAMSDWKWSVNGERLFVKGANLGPTRRELGEVRGEDLWRDVSLARDVGLDLVRVHGHISRPELYEAADELGVLVWQDFPLQWGYARQIRRRAVAQVREAVDLLAHHPSIALWCGHNEPFRVQSADADAPEQERARRRSSLGQQLPTWNRTILDRWVKRAFERSDDSRPIVAHSGVLPHAPQLNGTDSHLFFGWYQGDERDLGALAATMPRLVRFVGEFGAPSVPASDGFIRPERWPHLDWDALEHHHCYERSTFETRLPPDTYASFDDWRLATQQHQADVLRHQIETLRRLKYRPTGGFTFFGFADAQPAVSWGVLDHDRVPKLAYPAVIEACRPVIVVADQLPAFVAPGDAIALDVHVVSDLREALDESVVTARLSWPGGDRDHQGEHEWRFGGDVPADECVRVGTLQFVVPNARGHLRLDLTFEHADLAVTNRYEAMIIA
jgi:beta-mannosidase